jgi:hypothetical protein
LKNLSCPFYSRVTDLFLRVPVPKLIWILFFALLACPAFGQDPEPVRKQKPLLPPPSPAPLPNQQQREGRGSQVVDDSTKNVYGPKTALWITENDLFYNKNNYQPLDTTLLNYHRWTYVQRFNNYYQDLGNVGTALNPIFPLLSTTIGVDPGFSVYAPYYDTQEPIYFDTKSPYTSFRLVWGGDGRASSRVEYSRNINPRWNFGFNVRPLLVDKQIQRTGKGDRQTIDYYYDFYSSYKSEDDRYLLLFNARRIRHRVNENGGIRLVRDTTVLGYFDPNAVPFLTKATSEELRQAIHVYQQYRLARPLQLYHRGDVTKQVNIFTHDTSAEANLEEFFPFTVKDGDVNILKVKDEVEFKTIVNEVGIKGNAAFLFYNFYYKLRTFSTYNYYMDETLHKFKNDGAENYVGSRIAFRFDSLSELSGKAEYLLDGNYLLDAQLKTPWLDARGISTLAKPAFLPQAYRGAHHTWINDSLTSTFNNQLEAFLKIRWKRFYFSPGGRYTLYNNYIYYRENKENDQPTVLPHQSNGNQQIISPEARLEIRFLRHVYFRPQVIHTLFLKNDDEAIRIPEWFANVQLAYENVLFKKNIRVQIGADVHWRSAYKPLGYNPAIQQFYVQEKVISEPFPLVDIFFNGQFKRGRFFFKYNNLMNRFTERSYIITPGYRAQLSIIDFGFDLILFD